MMRLAMVVAGVQSKTPEPHWLALDMVMATDVWSLMDAYVTVIDANEQSEGYRCPVIGRVAMDMIVIDISDAPESLAIDREGHALGRCGVG